MGKHRVHKLMLFLKIFHALNKYNCLVRYLAMENVHHNVCNECAIFAHV